jgi:hypothetical protein
MTIATGQPLLASDINNLTFFPIGTILTFSSAAWSATSAEFKNIWKICNAANHAANPTIPDLTNKFLRGADSSGTTGGNDSRSMTLTTSNLPSHNHGATGLSLSGLNVSGLTAVSNGAHSHTVSGSAANEGGHIHTVTGTVDSGGAHYHSFPNWDRTFSGDGSKHGSLIEAGYGVATTSSDGAHGHIFSNGTTSGGGHTHSLTGTAGSGGEHTHSISGDISGGTISGLTANTGSGTALTIDILPSYYTVVYIMKVA